MTPTMTIFAAMRPFRADIGDVQRNAIRSWLAVRPACEVILIDDEEGTTAAAVADLPVKVVADVRRSGLGAPLLDSLLDAGAAHASGDVLAYITADILLPPNFAEVAAAVHRAMHGRPYFEIAGRFDLLRPIDLDFADPAWFDGVRAALETHGRWHRHTALDLWVYPREFRLSPPPFPIGRGGTDGWAVYEMRRLGVPVIDVTPEVCLVHQFHDRPARRDPRFHEELLECVRLFDHMPERAMSLIDADWIWREGRLTRPRGLRRLHAAMALFRPYRYLVGRKRRFALPHWYGAAAMRNHLAQNEPRP